MWAHGESKDSKWLCPLNAIQKTLCKSVVYYTIKQQINVNGELSYLLTLSMVFEYYLYFIGDVLYDWPQALNDSMGLVDANLFKTFGISVKLKNKLVCEECKKIGNILILQKIAPIGVFCLCNCSTFIEILIRNLH
jgi:hypothetical protein